MMNEISNKPTVFEGRVWVLRDPEGVIIDDIDTDMIFHNLHLAVTEIEQMGQYALGNLNGFEDFPKWVEPKDMILAGRNFGSGSSRQQAVDCLISLSCGLLIAESFGAIYKRNAINVGFPILEGQGITDLVGEDDKPLITSGDHLRVDLGTGEVIHLESERSHQIRPMSGVQLDIYQAGSLFAYADVQI